MRKRKLKIKYLLKNNKILWTFAKNLKRKIDILLYNRKYYLKYRKVSLKQYKDICNNYRKLEEKIIERVIVHQKERNDKIWKNIDKVYLENIKILSINGDEMGKAFEKDGKIYRGIYKSSEARFLKVWKTGVLQGLSDYELLPKVCMTNFYTDEFSLILEIDKVNINYMTVWSYAMLKDACILISVLKNILLRFNLTLQDGHMNNVTFYHGHPMFIDIGSIIPYQESGYNEELIFSAVYPLIYKMLGNFIMARVPIYDENNNGIWIQPRRYDFKTRECQYASKCAKKYYMRYGNFLALCILYKVIELNWIQPEYFDVLFPTNTEDLSEYEEYNLTKEWLSSFEKLKIQSICSVGGGYLVLKNINKSYSDIKRKYIDYNEKRLDYYYSTALGKNKNVDFYLLNYIYCRDNMIKQYIQSELVIVVDPINNIALYQNSSLASIFEILNKLTSKYIFFVFYLKHHNSKIRDNIREDEMNVYKQELYKKFIIIKDEYCIKKQNQREYYLALVRKKDFFI